MVLRTKLTSSKFGYTLEINATEAEHKSSWFPTGSFEVRTNNTLKTVSHADTKVTFKSNDETVKSVVIIHDAKSELLNFIKKVFFRTVIGFSKK